MTWFFAVIVVAVMGGIAVVAAGAGGSMAESFDDRPDARVPAEGPLTAQDLRRVRFSTAVRGYRMSEVDALLDRLAAEREPRHEPRGADPAGEHPEPATDPGPRREDRPESRRDDQAPPADGLGA
jgi:DivIVA domain-containing protein